MTRDADNQQFRAGELSWLHFPQTVEADLGDVPQVIAVVSASRK